MSPAISPDIDRSSWTSGATSGVTWGMTSGETPCWAFSSRSGDIIVELAGKKIENIYDYTHAIEALKIDQETTIVVQRGRERITLNVVPGSRE